MASVSQEAEARGVLDFLNGHLFLRDRIGSVRAVCSPPIRECLRIPWEFSGFFWTLTRTARPRSWRFADRTDIDRIH
jgi:hypothetical protein